jgi:hypothetical protein
MVILLAVLSMPIVYFIRTENFKAVETTTSFTSEDLLLKIGMFVCLYEIWIISKLVGVKKGENAFF